MAFLADVMFQFLLLFFICMQSQAEASITVVDMTYTYGPDTIFSPGSPAYQFNILTRGFNQELQIWTEANSFSTAEHGGTHIDAPSHYIQGQARAHQIPIERLVGPGVIINVQKKVQFNPNYQLSIQDLLDWEWVHGRIPNGAVVIMNSGWGSRYPNEKLVYGTSDLTDSSSFRFPSISEAAARWLLKFRDINVVGVDSPSIDPGFIPNKLVQRLFGAASITLVEQVANVWKVPASGSTIIVAPIKLYDGSGGPARVVAMFDTK